MTIDHEVSAPASSDDTDTDQPALRLKLLASSCSTSSCPTIYESDRGTLIVQGYAVSPERAGLAPPDGELLVEIPVELLGALRGRFPEPKP